MSAPVDIPRYMLTRTNEGKDRIATSQARGGNVRHGESQSRPRPAPRAAINIPPVAALVLVAHRMGIPPPSYQHPPQSLRHLDCRNFKTRATGAGSRVEKIFFRRYQPGQWQTVSARKKIFGKQKNFFGDTSRDSGRRYQPEKNFLRPLTQARPVLHFLRNRGSGLWRGVVDGGCRFGAHSVGRGIRLSAVASACDGY